MLKRLFFGIAALALAGAVFGQAYKWVDEDGVVHYSDRPQEGAEEIQLPTTQRSSQPSRSPTPATRQTTQAAEPAEVAPPAAVVDEPEPASADVP